MLRKPFPLAIPKQLPFKGYDKSLRLSLRDPLGFYDPAIIHNFGHEHNDQGFAVHRGKDIDYNK